MYSNSVAKGAWQLIRKGIVFVLVSWAAFCTVVMGFFFFVFLLDPHGPTHNEGGEGIGIVIWFGLPSWLGILILSLFPIRLFNRRTTWLVNTPGIIAIAIFLLSIIAIAVFADPRWMFDQPVQSQ